MILVLILNDEGFLYYLYIGTLVTFSANSINILAGANGVEGGQSLVLSVSLAFNNIILLSTARHDANRFSLYFLIPFVGTTSAYLRRNWYVEWPKAHIIIQLRDAR